MKPIEYDPLKDTLFASMPRVVEINYQDWTVENLQRSVEGLNYDQATFLWSRTQFCDPPANTHDMRLFCLYVEPAVLSLHQLLLRHIRALNPLEVW